MAHTNDKARKAMGMLHSAYEYLLPRMNADTMNGIVPNAESLSGSILARAMGEVIKIYMVVTVQEQCPYCFEPSKAIRAEIRELRSEMKAKGIKRISCFNGGLSGEVYSLNARMFALETRLQDALKHES